MVKTGFPLQGARVQSLMWELRSYRLHGLATKKKKKKRKKERKERERERDAAGAAKCIFMKTRLPCGGCIFLFCVSGKPVLAESQQNLSNSCP